jgi:hypothetical protein
MLALHPSGRQRATRGCLALVVVLAAFALAPSAADALSVALTMPDTVAVGQTGQTARLTLTNNTQSVAVSICDSGECSGPSEGIVFNPSCGSASLPPACASPDLGVFTFATRASVVPGTCGASPEITHFAILAPNPASGKLLLVPQGGFETQLSLGAIGTPQATCDITLTFGVARLPAIDAAAGQDGSQTLSSASAQGTHQGKGGPEQEDAVAGHVTTVLTPGSQPPPQPPAVAPPPALTAPANLDHFKCYEALQSGFRRRSVGLRDQFGQRRSRVLRTRELCNPVSMNEGRVLQPRAHLVCYETRDHNTHFVRRQVLVTNQLGRRRLTVTRPSRLCVPSLKRRTGALPSTPDPARLVDHFRCYDVTAQPAAQTVTLRDQFRTSVTAVLRVVRLCNPVRKNNGPVRRPRSHLVCYSIRDSRAFRPLGVRVRNPFGRASLRVRRPVTLCEPSFAQVIATTAPATRSLKRLVAADGSALEHPA